MAFLLLGNGPNGGCRSFARWADSAFGCRRKGCGELGCPILEPFEPGMDSLVKKRNKVWDNRVNYQTIRWTCSSFELLIHSVRYWRWKGNHVRPINHPADCWHYHCERVFPGDSSGSWLIATVAAGSPAAAGPVEARRAWRNFVIPANLTNPMNVIRLEDC